MLLTCIFYFKITVYIVFVKIQIMIPREVGIKKLKKVHFKLFVSFFMVKRVVKQGKCIVVNNITLIAVSKVQPFSCNIWLINRILSESIKELVFR